MIILCSQICTFLIFLLFYKPVLILFYEKIVDNQSRFPVFPAVTILDREMSLSYLDW